MDDSMPKNIPEKYVSKRTDILVRNDKSYKEAEPAQMNLSILQSNLGHCLSIIDDEVMKGYVTKLDQLPIIQLDDETKSNLHDIHFFKISELVYQEDEFSVAKLAMVFHALSNKPCTLVLMLKSNGEQTDFYLGVRPNGENSAGTLFQMLKQSLMGFFPGSRIADYYDEDMKADLQKMQIGCISSVTCVADYKQREDTVSNKEFFQGLEKYVYAMQGKSYTAVFIADNVSHDELMERKREYEQIYTQISPFANMQMNFSVSDGKSSSDGKSDGKTTSTSHTETEGRTDTETNSEGYTSGTSETQGTNDSITDTEGYTSTHTTTESESDGKTHTVGTSDGTSRTVTNGVNVGVNAGVNAGVNSSTNVGINIFGGSLGKSIGGYSGGFAGVSGGVSHSVANGTSHTDSVSDSITKTLSHGFSDSYGQSKNRSKGYGRSQSYGTSESTNSSKSVGSSLSSNSSNMTGEAFNLVNTKTLTESFGTSRGITLNAQNMTLKLALERIEKHLDRIQECESFGMWNFAGYFLGETASETETAANTYKAVIAGTDSGIERSAINSWNNDEAIETLKPYIKNFLHPLFLYTGFSYDEDRYVAVNGSALVSTNELAIHMGLPRHSVRGLPVVEHAAFAQEIICRKTNDKRNIEVGNIYHLGRSTNTKVTLDLNSLAMHTFITGSTGSGKSNAVYHLLTEARKKGIPFLVVEPAKGEYKEIFTDVRCFGTNPVYGELLKINPFSFPKGVHVLEHIDRIIEIFNVCWPMYAAMPAVLKESIEQAYISAGWDLDLSENTKIAGLYPTFDDVLRELNFVIDKSAYSSDTKGDYVGSLSTRISSLTNGINGRIFVSDEVSLEELFDRSAIIDISRVGAMETKSLIMGIIVLKLQEYRMSQADQMNADLRHLTVLEEAHNLLKKTSTEQSEEESNIVGKSVEMLTNAIAEIRTFGEGFIIVDQAPGLLDTAAIRNTNTKIVLRLPESMDREITGGAMALNKQQRDELSKLPTGVAAVYQNNWQEAVLCALPKYESYDFTLHKKKVTGDVEIRKKESSKLLHLLLRKPKDQAEAEYMKELIKISNVAAKAKKDLILNLEKRNLIFEWAVADFINKNFDFRDIFRGTSECDSFEEMSSIMMQNIEGEFNEFDQNELYGIMYYICRVEHEKYPENTAIEMLRTEYLKKKVTL